MGGSATARRRWGEVGRGTGRRPDPLWPCWALPVEGHQGVIGRMDEELHTQWRVNEGTGDEGPSVSPLRNAAQCRPLI